METRGKVIQVLPTQEGVSKSTGNQWKIQPYIIETLEQYPRKIYFEVFGEERINQNACDVNDVVNVSFDIESREYNGRWYTTCKALKVEKAQDEAREKNDSVIYPEKQEQKKQSTTTIELNEKDQLFPKELIEKEEDGNDLPF
jgi:hypothetical protein